MEVALTFGSVGDIIQLCQLAIQLKRAIGAGCNSVGESAIEYQELRDELDTLVRILMQVVATYEQYESSAYLDGLDEVAKNVVEQCFGYIKDALEHFQRRYGTSLTPGGSGNRIKDVFKKVEWATKEHDRIKVLRGKLRDGISRLSLIGNLVAEKTAIVDQATMLARIDEVQEVVARYSYDQTKILNILKVEREASKRHTRQLEEVKAKLAAQNEQLESQSQQLEAAKQQLVQHNQTSWSILSVAKDALSGILEVKTILYEVSQTVVRLHAATPSTSPGMALDPTMDLPVMIEDSLGRQVPIPAAWMETISWKTLSALLEDHFEGLKGHSMIKRNAYVLEESVSGKDLDRSRPLKQNLRRGMRITMSMVFENHKKTVTGACPRCGKETIAEKGTSIYCYTAGCKMWWRLDRPKQTGGSIKLTNPLVSEVVRKERNPTLKDEQPADPGDFQRVRFRQHAPLDPADWYCQTCRRPSTACTYGVTLVHDLTCISLSKDEEGNPDLRADELEWKRLAKEAELARRSLEEEKDGLRFDWRGVWEYDNLFETYDVVWSPERLDPTAWRECLKSHSFRKPGCQKISQI